MKIAIVDPYCIGGLEEYTNAYCSSLTKYTGNVILFANHYTKISNEKINVARVFFKISQIINYSFFRKVIRLLEYYWGWFLIIYYIKMKHIDIIHIMWLIHYPSDIFILKILKLLFPNIRLILTAHNIIPHNPQKSDINKLNGIYHYFSKILVHGISMKALLLDTFPSIKDSKVFVTYHGAKSIDSNIIKRKINLKLKIKKRKHKRIVLLLGLMNKNKGIERFYKIWKISQKDPTSLLIIAGKKNDNYKELSNIETEIKNDKSVLYFPYYLNQSEVNFLLSISDVVALPYLNGSVSGVLFNAAFFNKPVIATKFGSIEEYVIDGETSYLVENNESSILAGLNKINALNNYEIENIGINNHENIYKNFHWDNLVPDIIKNVYFQ